MINTTFRGALASIPFTSNYPTSFGMAHPDAKVDIYHMAGDPAIQIAAMWRPDGNTHLAISQDSGVSFHATKVDNIAPDKQRGLGHAVLPTKDCDEAFDVSTKLLLSFSILADRVHDACIEFVAERKGHVVGGYPPKLTPPVYGIFNRVIDGKAAKEMGAFLYAVENPGRLFDQNYLEERFHLAAAICASAVAAQTAEKPNDLQAGLLFMRAANHLDSWGMNETELVRACYMRADESFKKSDSGSWIEKWDEIVQGKLLEFDARSQG